MRKKKCWQSKLIAYMAEQVVQAKGRGPLLLGLQAMRQLGREAPSITDEANKVCITGKPELYSACSVVCAVRKDTTQRLRQRKVGSNSTVLVDEDTRVAGHNVDGQPGTGIGRQRRGQGPGNARTPFGVTVADTKSKR